MYYITWNDMEQLSRNLFVRERGQPSTIYSCAIDYLKERVHKTDCHLSQKISFQVYN